MISLAIGAFYVPPLVALAVYVFLIIFSLAFLRLSPKEILKDNFPALSYAALLYAISIFLNAINFFKFFPNENILKEALKIFIPRTSYVPLLLHLALSLELTSVFFKTTSVMQFNYGFRSIEHFFTRKERTPLADELSLTLTFIPRLTDFWLSLNLAWKARGGKDSPEKILKLTPALFKFSMNEAYTKAMAKENREP